MSISKTLRIRVKDGWTTKPNINLPQYSLSSENVDDNFLNLEDQIENHTHIQLHTQQHAIDSSTDHTGFGDSVTKNVGTGVNDVAIGNHVHSQLHNRQHSIDSMIDHYGAGDSVTKNTGTGPDDVASGDHDHTQLHTQQHAIDSSTDHTGFGDSVTRNVGTSVNDVASGNHLHDQYTHSNFIIIEDNYTAQAKQTILVKSSISSVTITLPSSGEINNGDFIRIIDYDQNSSINKIIINGDIGELSSIDIDIDGYDLYLIYNNHKYIIVDNSLYTQHQLIDNDSDASENNVGSLRYRSTENNSYCDICMKIGINIYQWVNIITNSW